MIGHQTKLAYVIMGTIVFIQNAMSGFNLMFFCRHLRGASILSRPSFMHLVSLPDIESPATVVSIQNLVSENLVYLACLSWSMIV